MHHALRAAFTDDRFAAERLDAVWGQVAIPAIDLSVDDRLVRLAPSQGEYLVLAAMIVLLPACYGARGRRSALTAEAVEAATERLPASVLAPERRRRAYLNAVLARAEVLSSYVPARKLWLRERRGEYLPNPSLAWRVTDEQAKSRGSRSSCTSALASWRSTSIVATCGPGPRDR